MAAKHKVTVSVRPTAPRPSSAERRAAQIANLATQQADLKREAAERREKRAQADAHSAAQGTDKPAVRRGSPN